MLSFHRTIQPGDPHTTTPAFRYRAQPPKAAFGAELCDLYAKGAQIVRAADCNPLSKRLSGEPESLSVSKKASQSLPPGGGKGILIIFCRGAPQGGLSCPFGAIHLLYLTENTTQAESVRLVRCKRTRRARSRLQSFCQKRAKPFFDSLRLSGEPESLLGRENITSEAPCQGRGDPFRSASSAAPRSRW